MQYENQKAACAEYAKRNGGDVADVLRVSGRKDAVVVSKDGRVLYDPFVIEPIREVVTNKPLTEMEEIRAQVEAPKPAQRRKSGSRKK